MTLLELKPREVRLHGSGAISSQQYINCRGKGRNALNDAVRAQVTYSISKKQKVLQQVGLCSNRWVASNFWNRQDDGSILLELDASVYSISACLRAAHEMSASYAINIKKTGTTVLLTVSATGSQELVTSDVGRIVKTVTDYTLREQLNVETAPIRNAILAAAFGKAKLPIRERCDEQ